MRYSSWNSRFLLLSTTYSIVINMCIAVFDVSYLFKLVAIYLLLALAVASKLHFVCNVAVEIANEMGIRVWKVKPVKVNIEQ